MSPTLASPVPAVALILAAVPAMSGELAKDVAVMAFAASADEGSTVYALRQCASCRESGPPTPLRLGGKAVVIGVSAAGAEHLRRSGHRGWARVVRWAPAVVWSGIAVNNMIRARQGAGR